MFQDCKLRGSTLTSELKSKSEYQSFVSNWCISVSSWVKQTRRQTQNVAVALSIHLLVTENTEGELVTHHSPYFNDNSSLKAVTTAAHLFSHLSGENCENEQYLTCVKHLKASVVCKVVPQTMGCLAETSGFISFSGPLVFTPVS